MNEISERKAILWVKCKIYGKTIEEKTVLYKEKSSVMDLDKETINMKFQSYRNKKHVEILNIAKAYYPESSIEEIEILSFIIQKPDGKLISPLFLDQQVNALNALRKNRIDKEVFVDRLSWLIKEDENLKKNKDYDSIFSESDKELFLDVLFDKPRGKNCDEFLNRLKLDSRYTQIIRCILDTKNSKLDIPLKNEGSSFLESEIDFDDFNNSGGKLTRNLY